ncbi:hypothetical protein Fcan01_27706 [Folsomia candida]|uniref:Uncharacterized protein n=1 Tax=Folsomia candida TaxID=158441 RepID=A0A226CYJ4_FOLCA|nr:hypothetical protein Fcan01_27706 [Folsomia candida]
MDISGIKILMPFSLLDDYESIPRNDYIRYKYFYMGLLVRCLKLAEQSVGYKRLVRYKKTLKSMSEVLQYHFGFDAKSGHFTKGRTLSELDDAPYPPPYNKSALQDFPIQPIEFDMEDSYKIVKLLSSCGKVALMETKDNIRKITTFLNDNAYKIAYVSGDGDFFFNALAGWKMIPVRESYGEKRLKVMLSSGIWAHWESLYKLWKPEKLLDYYANWTHPRVEAVSKFYFSSKIITGFYVCGISLVICILVLFVEIVKYTVSVSFTLQKISS